MNKEQIIKSKIYSPGLIGGSIVTFIPSVDNTFYIKHEGAESYLKDDKNKYVLFKIDAVVDARLLYLLSYEQVEKEGKIKSETQTIKKEVLEKVNGIIKTVKQFEAWREDSYILNILQSVVDSSERGKEMTDEREQQSKLFFIDNPDASETKERLIALIESGDYDSLYTWINFGKAAGVFDTTKDLTALVNTIGIKNIDKTIDKMKESALYLEAKIRVEKKYYPNE
jgi:hypothetical protein